MMEEIMGGIGGAAGAAGAGAEDCGAGDSAAGAGSAFRFLLSKFMTWAVLLVLESLFEAI